MSILVRPVITEKSMADAANGRYTFAVEIAANKAEIAAEIKKTFPVSVVSVKTITVQAKTKRAGKSRKEVTTGAWKKAIVEVGKGQKIDLFDVAEHAEKP